MAVNKEFHNSTEAQNWIKCFRAIFTTRTGIVDFVENEINRFHQDALRQVKAENRLSPETICNYCTTPHVVPCPTKGICNKRNHSGVCTFHNGPPMPCPERICSDLAKVVVSEHKYRAPSWKNVDVSKWCSSFWELAKCFLPPDGYLNITSAKDTDINGLISIVQNCNRFKLLLSPHTRETVCEQAREICRSVRLSADLKADSTFVTHVFDVLISFLNDLVTLNSDRNAITAIAQLNQLKNETSPITAEDITQLVENAKADLKNEFKTDEILKRPNILEQNQNSTNQKNINQNQKISDLYQRVSILELPAERIENSYDVLKKELQTDLVEYYKSNCSSMTLSSLRPDLDEELHDFYVQPEIKVVHVRKHIVHSSIDKGYEVSTYSDVFEIGNVRNIYIQGNPGMGKTSYCKKLTLDWCSYIDMQTNVQKPDCWNHKPELNFDFLFLISLREEADKTCEVIEMVQNAVISQLSHETKYESILPKVFDKERCLIILDGLDEWSHPGNGTCRKSQKHIPHSKNVGKCVYLTLTRPWKLSQIAIKDSEIDALFEIIGVRNPEELVTKVVCTLNRREKKSLNEKQFDEATKHLQGLKEIPIIAIQLVCLWHEDKTIANSQCEIYSSMIKMVLDRKANDNKPENQYLAEHIPTCFHRFKLSELEYKILLQLGKLAFETLYPKDGTNSHVIFRGDFVKHYLDDQIKIDCLSAGLLTERKVRSLNRKCADFSFLHKTFQEFLAAFYLFAHDNPRELIVERLTLHNGNIHDPSQLFIFLCGIKPSLAACFSHFIMKTVSQMVKSSLNKNKGDVMWYYISLQIQLYFPNQRKTINMFDDNECQYSGNAVLTVLNLMKTLNLGYHECVHNGHGDFHLEMTHICFLPLFKLKEELFQQNLEKIETLICLEETVFSKVMSVIQRSRKTIKTLLFNMIYKSVNLNECKFLESLVIATTKRSFDKLDREPFYSKNEQTVPIRLNLKRCKSLALLVIEQLNIIVVINTDHLHTCVLQFYDLSQGNIAETFMKRNSCLRDLSLYACRFFDKKDGENKRLELKLTSCSTLETLRIVKCDVIVSINTSKLQLCELSDYDLLEGNIAEELKHAKLLTELILQDFKFKTKRTGDIDFFHLDLSLCNNLKNLIIYDYDVAVSINAQNLRKCYLCGYDLSKGNIIYDLRNARFLAKLKLYSCKSNALNNCDNTVLDLTLSEKLENLYIFGCDISLSTDVTCLSQCELAACDLLQGNISENLTSAKSLISLTLWHSNTNTTLTSTAKDKPHIDLSSCFSLEKVSVHNFDIVLSINVTNLQELKLGDIDLSEGNMVEAMKNARSLNHLSLRDCNANAMNNVNSKLNFNLTGCCSLEELYICNCGIAVSTNTARLRICNFSKCDISQGNISEDLRNARILTELCLKDCIVTVVKEIDKGRFHLDLSLCSNLEKLEIIRCDFSLSINAAHLSLCEIQNCDLSNGNIVKQIENAVSLTKLILISCKVTEVRRTGCMCIEIDLTLCRVLAELCINSCNFVVKLNTTKLDSCDLTCYDMSQGNMVRSLKNSRLLSKLCLCDCKAIKINSHDSEMLDLDLTLCSKLMHLNIYNSDITVNIHSELSTCGLTGYDLSQGNIAEILEKANALRCVTLHDCKITKLNNSGSKKTHLDFSSCESLEELDISSSHISVNINGSSLNWCELSGYDMSGGNIAKVLTAAKSLHFLSLHDCKISALNTDNIERYHLDLSSCSNLEELNISSCDFALSIRATNLQKINLSDYDLTKGNIAMELKNAMLITQLTLRGCKTSTLNNADSKTYQLDLTSCSDLEKLNISTCDIAVNINSKCLNQCTLNGYDFSQGNVLEALENCTKLSFLEMKDCFFPETDKRHSAKACLDLSACKTRCHVNIKNSDIEVLNISREKRTQTID